MANRFSTTTTAGFKGLSLDEIMAIPMAKQAQQDASLSATDEMKSLQSQSLQGDNEVVDAELERIRSESEAISKQLLERGTDRDLSNKLRQLRSSMKKSFGASGVVGQSKANYTSAQKYINDLATNKAQQAGWSPQEAKLWATKQVSAHGSSFDKLGNFKQFQGAGLPEYVNSTDWILDGIKNVSSDKMPIELQKYNGPDGKLDLGSVKMALASGSIEKKTLNKILTSLSIAAKGDNKLMNSLRQEAYFSGADPDNVSDFGGMKIEYDKNGKNPEDVWVPGKSSFGRQLYGFAYGAQSTSESRNYKIVDDPILEKLRQNGLSSADANAHVMAINGIHNTVNRNNFDKLKNQTNMALTQLEQNESTLLNTFGPEELDENNKEHDAFAKLRKEQPKTYAMAKKAHNDSMLKHNKFNNWMSRVEDVALKGFSKEKKESYDLSMNLDRIKDKSEAERLKWLRSEFDKIKVDMDSIELDGKHTMYSNKDQYTAQLGDGAMDSDQLLIKLIDSKGLGKIVDKTKMSTADVWRSMDRIQDIAKDDIQKELNLNPYSESYKSFSGIEAGTEKNAIGIENGLLSKSFAGGGGYSVAYDGTNLNSYLQAKFPEGDNEKVKFKYEIRVTNANDSDGHPIEELIVKNSANGTVMPGGVIAVTRGADGKVSQRKVANVLRQSNDPQLREYGTNMVAAIQYMPEIKTSSIRSGALSGTIDGMYHTDSNKKRVPITWKKTESAGQTFWTLHLGAEKVSGELMGEQAIANFLYNQSVVDEDI